MGYRSYTKVNRCSEGTKPCRDTKGNEGNALSIRADWLRSLVTILVYHRQRTIKALSATDLYTFIRWIGASWRNGMVDCVKRRAYFEKLSRSCWHVMVNCIKRRGGSSSRSSSRSRISSTTSSSRHGRNLGGTGGRPHKIWGGGTAHASVPPIFGEAVLLEACLSTNRLKNGVKENFFMKYTFFIQKREQKTDKKGLVKKFDD